VENPHSRPGQALYNRFVLAWEAVADQSVITAFHGTPEANIDAICRTGLDPNRRSGQAHGPGEYFATNATTSLGFVTPSVHGLVVYTFVALALSLTLFARSYWCPLEIKLGTPRSFRGCITSPCSCARRRTHGTHAVVCMLCAGVGLAI
jgi:hypothetical protein